MSIECLNKALKTQFKNQIIMQNVAFILALMISGVMTSQSNYQQGMQNAFELWEKNQPYQASNLFERIAQAPLSFPSVDHIRPGYRRAVCGVDSIYFRQNDDMVEIMAILGGQQSELWL